MSARGAAAPEADARELRRRLRTTADVLTRFSEMKELEDGYAFRFPRTKRWTETLRVFTDEWRRSCPHMSFEIEDGGGDPLWLRIRGPEGTKQFIEGSRTVLVSNLNPAPSFTRDLRLALRYLTSPLRVMPDFVIIGAKKCATTTLYSYLTQHPSIAPAFRKEIYYFNACWGKGPAWYRAFFPSVLQRQVSERIARRPLLTGEATPDYLFHPHSAPRLARTLPNARLIAILRDPVDRAHSAYHHNLRAGLETLSFEEAIDREEERLAGEREKVEADETYFSFAWEHHSYLTRGIYVDQLEHWTRYFPREQLLVLNTSHLWERPAETLRSALDFLGLPYREPRGFKKLNAVPYDPMSEETRARLRRRFEPHNRRLAEFLGEDPGW